MTADLLQNMLRHDRAVVLGSLAAVILLAWAYLLLGGGIGMEMMEMSGQMMAMAPAWTPGYATLIVAMWAIMMVAMMLPGAAPVILLVASIARKRAAGTGALPVITALFVLGYISVWFGFSVGATALQWWVAGLGLLSETMATSNAIVAGGVLVAAGLYEWTPLKDSCLRHCRSPLDFLLYHWRDGALGAVSSGFRHGLFCLGCCWMLMALLFVGGIMNLLWIAAIALLVLLEKTVPWGRRMSRVTGSVLVLWGGTILVLAI